jgi:hypothetical protein
VFDAICEDEDELDGVVEFFDLFFDLELRFFVTLIGWNVEVPFCSVQFFCYDGGNLSHLFLPESTGAHPLALSSMTDLTISTFSKKSSMVGSSSVWLKVSFSMDY